MGSKIETRILIIASRFDTNNGVINLTLWL